MKTFSPKPTDITRTWYVIDASEAPLGRVATKTASLLLGKAKPNVSPHMDSGDYVIIINSDQLVVTGNKRKDKMYYRHSGFPGGLSQRSLEEVIQRDSTRVIVAAVRGMLPVNKLRPGRLERLKVYTGSEHTHAPQKPVVLSMKKESV
jgi:large subunit ribosomal protein L13